MEIDLGALAPRDAHDVLVSALIPRPIAWVSSISGQGQVNLAPFSFFCGVTWSPATLGFSVVNRSDGSRKDTIVNIEETGQFVVNMVSHDLAGRMVRTASSLPERKRSDTTLRVSRGRSPPPTTRRSTAPLFGPRPVRRWPAWGRRRARCAPPGPTPDR